MDTGSVMLPVAIDALYGYGIGQAQYRIEDGSGPALGERRASVGAGLGLRVRPLGRINVNLEVGVSYRIDTHGGDRWEAHTRSRRGHLSGGLLSQEPLAAGQWFGCRPHMKTLPP